MPNQRMALRAGRRRLPGLLLAVAAVALAAHVQASAPHNFLWKASGQTGVVYLVGSLHMLTQRYYPLDPAIQQAFQESDLLVEEVDLGEMLAPQVQLSILMLSRLPDGQTLDKVLSPATMALLNKFTADLGAAAEVLNNFKPWMLATVIEGLELLKAGFNPTLGLDRYFYDLAVRGGKAVKGLETAEYQISLFDQLTMDQQDRFLAETLKQLATEKANVTRLADAWRLGDADTIERIVLAELESDAAIYQRLLVERNRNWLPQIEALFTRPGRTFVVVGAAHLVGPDGLLQLLKAKGYRVEQM